MWITSHRNIFRLAVEGPAYGSTNLTEHFVIVCSNKDISALTIEPRYSDRFI